GSITPPVANIDYDQMANANRTLADQVEQKKGVTDLLKKQAMLLELAHDAIIGRDLEGGIRFWNRGVESLYASSKEEVMDSLSHKLLRTSFPCPFEETQLQLIEAGHRGQ